MAVISPSFKFLKWKRDEEIADIYNQTVVFPQFNLLCQAFQTRQTPDYQMSKFFFKPPICWNHWIQTYHNTLTKPHIHLRPERRNILRVKEYLEPPKFIWHYWPGKPNLWIIDITWISPKYSVWTHPHAKGFDCTRMQSSRMHVKSLHAPYYFAKPLKPFSHTGLETICKPLITREKLEFPDWWQMIASSSCEIYC